MAAALSEQLDDVLQSFGVEVTELGKSLVGACPVHGGDNPTGFAIYPETGHWRCWTHACESTYFGDSLGLVRGLLKASGEPSSFHDAVRWASRFLGGLPKADLPSVQAAAKRRFGRSVDRLTREAPIPEGVAIETACESLEIPSPYFLGRGFDATTLREFRVGEERAPGSMTGRATVPILDQKGERVVGFTSRSVHPECEACGFYHGPGNCEATPKWRNHDFTPSTVLYGWHQAYESMVRTGEVVLVEGCGDVWSLRAAGITNVVGVFGSRLLDGQAVLLECSGALSVVVAFDGDEAGDLGRREAIAMLGRLFNVRGVKPPLEYKDWGEIPQDVLAKYWE